MVVDATSVPVFAIPDDPLNANVFGIFDEPIGNLDTTTGNIILDLMRRAADEFDTAILMATHSADSTRVTDRRVEMRDGLIV